MNEFDAFADFQFELGDIVHQQTHPQLSLIILCRHLSQTPAGIERSYFVRSGSPDERFEGELYEIELQKS